MPPHQRPDRATIVPRIVTPDVAGLAGFIIALFDATGEIRADQPTELRIGDSLLMVSDGGGVREAMAAFLYVHVLDADATHARALALGAVSLEPPEDMPWGDRRATLRDAWGNIWQVATYLGG